MYSWVKLSHLAQWTGAEATKSGPKSEIDIPVHSLTTDSRSLIPGEIFLALKGEKFDGHDYIEQAIKRGAGAILSEREVAAPVPLLKVADSLKALVAIGENLRNHFKGKVVAITGSAGKSSTKEMVATLLGPDTVRAPASFNNLIGVSKTLLLVEDSTKNLVLEIGMNASGEIAEICRHFRPQAGIITNIGTAHLGRLGSQRNIYLAKKELFDSLAAAADKSLGVALNLDDSLVVEAHAETLVGKVPVVTYSCEGKDADVTILEKGLDPATGFLFLRARVRGESFECRIPIFGMHQAQNIAAAMAGALILGAELKDFKARLADIRPADHRGEVWELGEGRVLIDESYNSNPTALNSALTSLAKLDASRRRVLVLGEMRELGDFSEKLHAEVGETLANLHTQRPFPLLVIGVGNATAPLLDAVRQKIPGTEAYLAADVDAARTLVAPKLKPKDIIFVKGSRGIRLDALVTEFVTELHKRPLK